MTDPHYGPELWLQQAEEARSIVKYMGEPYAKQQMIMIAQAYSHLAQYAQEQAKRDEGIKNLS